MLRKRCADLVAVIVLLNGWTACAWASDGDTQPLFTTRDGRRVPVAIIAGSNKAGATRHALLEVIEPGQAPRDPAPQRANPPDSPAPDTFGPRDAGQSGRRQEVGYYGGYPVSYYNNGNGWDYGSYYANPFYSTDYGDAVRDAYWAQSYVYERERGREFNERDMAQRRQRVLNSFEKALRTGLDDLKAGDYAQAMVALTMATELNQGDPASRIHLAQAQMALGHYDDAAQALRRALQLQPNLKFVPLDLGRYYSDPDEFEHHVNQLVLWVKQRPASADVYFLLGYMEFQREDFGQAYTAFQIALRGAPNDSLVRDYLKLTKPPGR